MIRLEKANLCRTEEEDIDFDFIWVQLLSMKEAGYTMGGKLNVTLIVFIIVIFLD